MKVFWYFVHYVYSLSLSISPSLSLFRPRIAHFRWFCFAYGQILTVQTIEYMLQTLARYMKLIFTLYKWIRSVGCFFPLASCVCVCVFMRSYSVMLAYRRYSQKFTETWNESDITVHSKPHALRTGRQRNFRVSTPMSSISNKLIRRHRWSQAKPNKRERRNMKTTSTSKTNLKNSEKKKYIKYIKCTIWSDGSNKQRCSHRLDAFHKVACVRVPVWQHSGVACIDRITDNSNYMANPWLT